MMSFVVFLVIEITESRDGVYIVHGSISCMV